LHYTEFERGKAGFSRRGVNATVIVCPTLESVSCALFERSGCSLLAQSTGNAATVNRFKFGYTETYHAVSAWQGRRPMTQIGLPKKLRVLIADDVQETRLPRSTTPKWLPSR